jgi:hypothetical protein
VARTAEAFRPRCLAYRTSAPRREEGEGIGRPVGAPAGARRSAACAGSPRASTGRRRATSPRLRFRRARAAHGLRRDPTLGVDVEAVQLAETVGKCSGRPLPSDHRGLVVRDEAGMAEIRMRKALVPARPVDRHRVELLRRE